MSRHSARISWTRGDARFVDGRYSRAHRWEFDGEVAVPASASPHVVPLPLSVENAVDPEEAFVAALASCHMLWFLSIAATRGFLVEEYRDDASGTLAPNRTGRPAMTEVTLRPRVRFGVGRHPSDEEHGEMHREAHERCFLAASVTTELRCLPSIAEPEADAR